MAVRHGRFAGQHASLKPHPDTTRLKDRAQHVHVGAVRGVAAAEMLVDRVVQHRGDLARSIGHLMVQPLLVLPVLLFVIQREEHLDGCRIKTLLTAVAIRVGRSSVSDERGGAGRTLVTLRDSDMGAAPSKG